MFICIFIYMRHKKLYQHVCCKKCCAWRSYAVPLLPFPLATVLTEEEREAVEYPRSTAGQAGGSFPLRLPLRRRESEGTPVLWFRRVDSRAVVSGGVVGVVVAAPWWNKGAGGFSPSRRCLWRLRRAAGFVCSRIPRSGERWLSGRGRRGGGSDLVLELLSPVLVFAMVRSAPASRWRC